MHLIGPFKQIITCAGWPLRGPIRDTAVQPIEDAGVLINEGVIQEVGTFDQLNKMTSSVEDLKTPQVLIPGFIDAHTHICWAGSRANDYALRISGKSYLEIAKAGGGIWQTVEQTRDATELALQVALRERIYRMLSRGVTTIEVKSGYGLDQEHELRMLRIINQVNLQSSVDLVPTCLAAHIKPPTWPGDNRSYLAAIAEELLPRIKAENLSERVDIFIEESAFSKEEGADFLKKARNLGFKITVHADQFSSGGSALGRIWDAVSVDHLEAINAEDIRLLAESNTVATVLPNASLGLGIPFAPARRILDAGAILAIASDWNPGSAPMGDLITGAALLSAYEKLSTAEVLAGLTFRAAQAISLTDRGRLQRGKLADMQSYAVTDYREILYHQGQLTPHRVWKKGELLYEA